MPILSQNAKKGGLAKKVFEVLAVEMDGLHLARCC